MITETQKAYAAGFFDGEGSISIAYAKQAHTGKRYHRLQITIGNTNDEILLWFQEMFGGFLIKSTTELRSTKWKAARRWAINSVQAHNFLLTVRPYLQVKAAQADIAIAFRETHIAYGGGSLSEETMEIREQLRQQLLLLNQRGPSVTIITEQPESADVLS